MFLIMFGETLPISHTSYSHTSWLENISLKWGKYVSICKGIKCAQEMYVHTRYPLSDENRVSVKYYTYMDLSLS